MIEHREPLYFGDVERPLFGWLHRPASPMAATIGLVVCGPLGYEAVCAHRSVRHFADAAAANGLPALRFDYDGTGDSAGSDLDPDRVSAWIRSINSAIEALKAHAGVERVCIVGIRLGATLAALAASDRKDIAGLATIAPIVSGKAYLRELRALSLARPQPEPPAGVSIDPDLHEVAGFTSTAQTREQLAAVDLMKLGRVPTSMLVVDRDDMPANDKWVGHLRSLGATIDHRRLPGYTEMMLDSHETVVPAAMIDAMTEWLKHFDDAQASAAGSKPHAPRHSTGVVFQGDASGQEVLERAVRIGSEENLFGILTAPAQVTENVNPGIAVLLLNSGAVHHIGPNRLYVGLARRWAASGVTVLRLDLSGLGDSPPRAGEPENVVYSKRAQEDVNAAILFLKSHCGATHVHAIGLCSGAYHSFKSAVAGASLRTVVSINPLTFAYHEGESLAFPAHRIAQDVMRYKTNVWQWASWKKLLTGGVDISELTHVLLRRAVSATTNFLKDFLRRLRIPLPNDLGTELAVLGQRDVNLLFVFANGEPGIDLLESGGGSVVKRLRTRKRLDIKMIDGADHTFTSRWTRDQLADLLTAHVEQWKHAH